MRLFLKKILFGFLFLVVVLIISSVLVLKYPNFFYNAGYCKNWIEIEKCIAYSKQEIESDTLYVGDSVGEQFFSYSESDKNNYLTTNAKILAIGNYILIYNAISNNPHITTVIYLSCPQTIGANFERAETCDNFIKPFLTFENKKHFDEDFYKKLDPHPFAYLYFLPFYKVLPVPEINFSDTSMHREYALSDFSIHWINKIDSLCRGNQVKFILASPPIANSLRSKTKNWQKMKDQIKDFRNKNIYLKFLSTVQYCDDKYLMDEIHWNEEFLEANREKLVKNILGLYSKCDTIR
jgi:hypothetical protein